MPTTPRKKSNTEAAAVWVPIEDLTPWTENPRKNDGRPVDAVADSIKRFGFASPIIARKENGEVIAGHTRLKAAELLGLDRVPVRYLDLDPADAHLLALADNKIGELAEWDDDILSGLLADLDADDLLIAGFDDDDLASILGDEDPVGPDDIEPEPPPEEPESEPGEVYELGPHRLICGDSTDPEVFAKLCADGQVDAMWTDPPYGVSYVGGTGLTIQNDDLDEDGLRQLLDDSLSNALSVCRPGAACYVASPAGPLCGVFGATLASLGVWRQMLVWVKDAFVLGRSDYHYKHEPIFYGWKPGASHSWLSGRDHHSLLEFDRPKVSKEHPTMKPIALIEYCLRNNIRAGSIVLDPFGGSGSTLIAASRIGAKARLVELDPKYCDVIRKRWTAWAKEAGQDPGPGALE